MLTVLSVADPEVCRPQTVAGSKTVPPYKSRALSPDKRQMWTSAEHNSTQANTKEEGLPVGEQPL